MKKKISFILLTTAFLYFFQSTAHSHFRLYPHSHTMKSGDYYIVVPSIAVSGKARANSTGLNVRTGPGNKYEIISTLTGGTELTIKGGCHLSLSNWVYIDIPGGGHGWINKKHTSKINDDDQEANDQERIIITNQAYDIKKPYRDVSGKVRVTTEKLYVLSGPDEKYDAIDVMEKGTTLEAFGRGSHTQTKWLYIKRPNGAFGWIDNSFAAPVEPVILLPVTKDSGTVMVVAEKLDVYTGPGSKYQIINTVKSGTKLNVFGVGKMGMSKWIYVQMPEGNYGWINRNGTSVL